jgi:type IV secretion system protein VirB5
VRNILPTTTMDATTLLSGDLTKLGALGTQASQIQSRYTISASPRPAPTRPIIRP